MAADIERLSITSTCKACGGGYIITTLEQKYCSKPCKRAAYLERRTGIPAYTTLGAYWDPELDGPMILGDYCDCGDWH